MTQQINLYKIEKKKISFDFSFFKMLWVFGVFLVLILVVSAYDVVKHLTIRKELNVLGKDQLAKTEKLQVISGQVPEEKARDEIVSEIKKYEIEKQTKQEMLSLLISAQTSKISGFSTYFESLAKEAIPGIWLTNINFKENGDYISLEGKALNARYVPKLILGLSDEPVFKEKTFQLLKISLDDKTNQWNFTLETKSKQQP